MKKVISVIAALLLCLSLCSSIFAADEGSESKARKAAQDYISSYGIADISTIASGEQTKNITIDSKYYISAPINRMGQLGSVKSCLESGEQFTYVAMDNNRPAALLVSHREGDKYTIGTAGGNPSEYSDYIEKFTKATGASQYIMLDGTYERYVYGTVNGKDVLMPAFNINENDYSQYKDASTGLILIPKDTFNKLLKKIQADFNSGDKDNIKMGGSSLAYLSSVESDGKTMQIIIWSVAGGAFLVAAAITIVLVMRKKHNKSV